VAELSKAVGVNPPSLYLAFGSKAGLFKQALAAYSASQGAFFEAAFRSEAPVTVTVERMLQDAVAVYTQDPECHGCLIMDGARNSANADAVQATQDIKRAALAGFEALFRRETSRSAKALAHYVMFVLTGLSASAADGATADQLLLDVHLSMEAVRRTLGQDAVRRPVGLG